MTKKKLNNANLANPFTDSQFKIIFNEETTRAFLNSILRLESPIVELTIQNCESNDTSIYGHRVYFDVLCKDETGRMFIVEMQNAWKDYLRNRLVFYTCRRVNEMGRQYESKEGYVTDSEEHWRYKFQPVYTICLLNDADGDNEKQFFRQDVMLCDVTNHLVFSDRIHIIYINLKLLDVSSETAEYYEKYLSLLRQISENMRNVEELIADIDAMPVPEKDKKIFRRVVSVSDISQMNEKQRIQYEEELMFYLDQKAWLSSAKLEKIEAREKGLAEGKAEGMAQGRAEGMAQGRAQGRAEGDKNRQLSVAKKMLAKGKYSDEEIADLTGLSKDEIFNLK